MYSFYISAWSYDDECHCLNYHGYPELTQHIISSLVFIEKQRGVLAELNHDVYEVCIFVVMVIVSDFYFQNYLASHGLKFESVAVSFHQVSNIFNFKIRRMSPDEIRAHALDQKMAKSTSPSPRHVADDSGDSLLGVGLDQSLDHSPADPIQAPGDALDVSVLPVSDGSPGPDIPDSSSHISTPRRAARKPACAKRSWLDSGLNSSAGNLIFIIRFLLVTNFFISCTFLHFL